ncbi:NUDIX hydrolase [Nocardioides sp. URHA0020]|uniref:NUDIX hydrolase n=1 Tax=Nocardioides sp. URHA0020 TaxID=1380392 RepID=UPI00048DDAE1|nr:NUDIX domain-containing protein [Nocardioides sp. URHA0020]
MPRPIRKRTTGRVLPVNAAGEVLLLHGWDPAKPAKTYWFSIGGEVEHGEFHVEAAAREMRVGLGISVRAADLTAPIAHDVVEFDFGMWHLVQDQTYFATRLDDLTGLSFDAQEGLERGTIDEAAWWTPDALDADGTAANDQLTQHMRTAVRAILGEAQEKA